MAKTKVFSYYEKLRDRLATSTDKVNNEYDSSIRLTPMQGLAIFSGIGVVGMSIGATIGTYVFFGTVTLVGLIALIESNPKLKWLAVRSRSGVDILIFVATIYATSKLGITVSAALTFAGLGYTLIYSPWLRHQRNNKKKPKTRYWAYKE